MIVTNTPFVKSPIQELTSDMQKHKLKPAGVISNQPLANDTHTHNASVALQVKFTIY